MTRSLTLLLATALAACADLPDAPDATGTTAEAPTTEAPAADAPSAIPAPAPAPIDLAGLDGAWMSPDGTVVELQGETAKVAQGGLAPTTAAASIRQAAGAAIVDLTLDDGSKLTFTFDGDRLVDANGGPLVRR
jgi:glucose/arabinose dehydrogenase